MKTTLRRSLVSGRLIVADLFERGYSYKMPLTLKVDSKDSFFFNFVHKSEFENQPAGLVHMGEWKMKYERNKKMLSFLASMKKAEIEAECEPKVGRPIY